MSTLKFSAADWREAYDRAEEKEFDVIDSREQRGELAGVVAELREEEGGNDESLVLAAITVAGGLAEEYDRDFLARVIQSWDEEAEKGMADRARGYILARWPDFPIEDIDDLERFGAKHAVQAHERVGHDDEYGCWFLFDVSKLMTEE
jgi:hypothetical protein